MNRMKRESRSDYHCHATTASAAVTGILTPTPTVGNGWYSKSQKSLNWELICVQEAAVDLVSTQGGIRLEVELEIEGVE
jgi:hypothetical protein